MRTQICTHLECKFVLKLELIVYQQFKLFPRWILLSNAYFKLSSNFGQLLCTQILSHFECKLDYFIFIMHRLTVGGFLMVYVLIFLAIVYQAVVMMYVANGDAYL